MKSEMESFTRDWYYRTGHMTTDIELAVGTEPMAIYWEDWLNRPLWSKKEAVLLICGLEPNEFHQVESHKEYKSMCIPFIQLFQRTLEESDTSPFDWLKKFKDDGYLDCAPRGVHDWLTQQIEQVQLKPQAELVEINNISNIPQSKTWTREEISLTAEFIHNNEFIDWDYWADLTNITPSQAARLAKHINPIKWPDYKYYQGDLPDDLRHEIVHLTQWLDSREQLWTLVDLVAALGEDVAPFGMIQAIRSKPEPQTEAVENNIAGNHVEPENATPRERELKQGLREIWIKEGRPEMKMFFPGRLKMYVNKEGSPITAVYTAGKDAGIGFKLSTGTTGHRLKKTISNYVSEFKKTS